MKNLVPKKKLFLIHGKNANILITSRKRIYFIFTSIKVTQSERDEELGSSAQKIIKGYTITFFKGTFSVFQYETIVNKL